MAANKTQPPKWEGGLSLEESRKKIEELGDLPAMLEALQCALEIAAIKEANAKITGDTAEAKSMGNYTTKIQKQIDKLTQERDSSRRK